jgi:hypothetical protein
MDGPRRSVTATAPAGSERFYFFPVLNQAGLAQLEVQTGQSGGSRYRVDRQVEHRLRIPASYSSRRPSDYESNARRRRGRLQTD